MIKDLIFQKYKKQISAFALGVILTLIVLAIRDQRAWNKAGKIKK